MYYKYAFPELFDGIPRPDFHSFNHNIVIYGAGFQGLLTAYLLEQQGIQALCFGDQAKSKQNTTYYGLPVCSPEEMVRRYPDAAAIVTPYSLRPAYEYVRDELGYGGRTFTPFSLFLEFESGGFNDLLELPDWYHPDSMDYTVDWFMRHCVNMQTTNSLLSADIILTEVCNLRCKNCTDLMPNYQRPQHYDADSILRDVMTLLKGRRFHHFLLEGGEIFLWKPLPYFLRALCEAQELMRIIIVTNGTVLPNADVLDALRHPKVGVRISDYGTITKKKELSELLEANHIRYWITAQKWYELSVFHKEPLSGAAFERLVSDCCKANGTAGPYIINGKMFRCPIHAHLHRLGVFPANEKDYVDLRGTDQEYVQKRISEYIDVKRTPPSVDLCRHCDGRGYNGIEVPPAEQLAPGETIQVRFE